MDDKAQDKPKLSIPERRALVVRLYQSGHTTRQIAERLGISYQAVHQMLQRLDVPLRPRGGNMGSHSRHRR
jgi:transposase